MKKNIVFALTLMTLSVVCFADIAVPEVDPLIELLKLFQNFGVMSTLAKAMACITISVQLVKKFFPNFEYLRALTVLAGVLYGFLQSLSNGMSIFDSAVFVFITSGGAMILYDLFFKKPLNAVFKVAAKP